MANIPRWGDSRSVAKQHNKRAVARSVGKPEGCHEMETNRTAETGRGVKGMPLRATFLFWLPCYAEKAVGVGAVFVIFCRFAL